MIYRFISVILVSAILLTGCATVSHVPMDKQNSKVIKTVYVNPEIKKPATMYEFASGAQFGLLGGAVGGLLSGVASAKEAMTTQQFAEKNNIEIQKIVYQRWINQINSNSRFKLSNKNADATLVTDIVLYGISIPHGFSTDYVPVLFINAKLMRDDKIIWQDSEQVSCLANGMPRYKMDQIISDPKKLYAMWDKASEKIINEMLADMNK